MTSFRKCHILKSQNSSPNWDSSLHSSITGRLGKQMYYPLHHTSLHFYIGCVVISRAAPDRTPMQDIHCLFSHMRALPKWPFTSLNTQKPHMDTNTQQDLASVMGIMHRAWDIDQYPQKQTNGNKGREEGNKHQYVCSQRSKMGKAERLSKRYFRISSWNCASANRQDIVLEKMVYNFDVVYLQETRTCPPVLQGCGMALVVQSNLSKTESSLNLEKWSTSSSELHLNRKTRWETQIPDSAQCMHAAFHLHHWTKLGFRWDG